MVYYRKYRPQTINDLDSEKLRETLYAVLSGKNVPHAFLFTGPKGLGKTSTARIVAKVVNCEHIKQNQESRIKNQEKRESKSVIATNDIEPDNTCDQCISITNGTNIDVLEIDGASNRGIDEIRELRERVNLAPSSAKKKVYIIDEVHMLTTEAFNALLKTIEEPPSHVMFLFCTTEPHKVPATILSRCFHISFQLATEEEIVHSLQRIVKGEKLHVDEEALHVIAKMAEGGFRDATKILEEMVSLAGEKPVTKMLVEEKYHTGNVDILVFDLLIALHDKKIKEAVGIIKNVVDFGTDMKYFLTKLLEKSHNSLLTNVGLQEENSVRNIAFSLPEIQTLSSLFSQAYQETKYAVIPQLPLELAVIQYCSSLNDSSQDQEEQGRSKIHLRTSSNTNTMDTLRKKQQAMKVKALLGETEEKKVETKIPTQAVHQSDISSKPDDMTALYENIIYKVKPYNHSIAGVLRGSKIKEVTDSAVIFEAAYKFHKERLEDKKTCEIIEKAVKEVTGKNLKVTVVIKK